MRLIRQVTLSALSLALLLAAGCIEPVRLAVNPITPAVAPSIDRPCPGADCLAAGRPRARVTLAPDEEFLWARVSPDGRTLVGAISARGEKRQQSLITFAAFDIGENRELWRMRLAEKARIDAGNIFFAGDDRIALLAEGGLTWKDTLLVLDRATGRELWRTPREGDKAAVPAHAVWYDRQGDVFVVSSTTTLFLDAKTGQVVATRDSPNRYLNQRVTGGLPVTRDADLYLYDSGLVRVSRADSRVLWSRRFATFARDNYRGANIGLAVAGALLGGGASSIPPDYLVGRTTEPVLAGNRVIVGALGRVYAIDADSGNLVWAQDLAVPQVARLAVRGDRVYALAGGNYIFWHGRQGMSVREPVRHGLYAFNLADGTPVASFRSPFNTNNARTVPAAEVESFDEDDAFDEEEDWGDLANPAAATAAAKAGTAFSATRLVDFALLDGGLLVLTPDAVVVLDDNGNEVQRETLGDLGKGIALERAGSTLLVRTRDGVAAFDPAGATLWRQNIAAPLTLEVVSPGYVPVVRTAPWRRFRETEAKHLAGGVFWMTGNGEVLVVPSSDGRLVGLRVRDGGKAWEIPAGPKVAVENGYVVSIRDGTAEVHRIAD